MVRKVAPRAAAGPETFAKRAGARPRPDHLPGVLLPVCQKAVGHRSRRTCADHGAAARLRELDREDSAQSRQTDSGIQAAGSGSFYYPRRGYGQISQCLFEAAQAAGADFKFGARFVAIDTGGEWSSRGSIQLEGKELEIATSTVWSTIPISILLQGMNPAPPADVLASASSIAFRGMILIYLVLERITTASSMLTTSLKNRFLFRVCQSRRHSARPLNRGAGRCCALSFPTTLAAKNGI